MRADVAIESMVMIMVAIIAAGLLIALAFGRLPQLAKSLSCSAHSIMYAIVPSGDVAPELPDYCAPPKPETPMVSKDRNQTTEEIAAYILDCWEKGERGGSNESFPCSQFSVDYSDNFVIEPTDVVKIYLDNDLCTSSGIMDNATGCGSLNQIQWNKSQFKNKDFILIEYTPGKVMVR
jgi:hypothetical protein